MLIRGSYRHVGVPIKQGYRYLKEGMMNRWKRRRYGERQLHRCKCRTALLFNGLVIFWIQNVRRY
jgi:hypothetical protein